LDYLRLFDDLISLMLIDLYIETLRKYPPVPGLNRICTKDYKVPGSNIMIKKDTKVWIPVLGLQRDPEFYPDPEKFDPERFSEENKNERHPYTFIPFGEGPRVCIGTYILLYSERQKYGINSLKIKQNFFQKNLWTKIKKPPPVALGW
jgi:hypothetical protein